jgi:hypothetical protein
VGAQTIMKTWGMWACLLALTTNVLISCPLFADTSTDTSEDASKDTPPVVLIISQGSRSVQRANSQSAREERFITQTRLALDPSHVITVSNASPDFFKQPFSERIEAIRRMARQQNAVVVLWLEETAGDLTLMYLVSFRSGQPTVRTVDARTGPDAALELSLAAQELLSKPFVPAQTHNAAILPASERPTTKAPTDIPPDTRLAKPPAFSLMAFVALGGGISDTRGYPLYTGGGVALDWRIKDGFRMRGGIRFSTGLKKRYDFGTLYPLGIQLEIGQSYLFDFGKIQLGPATAVSLGWQQLTANLKTTGRHVISWWRLSMEVAMDLRVSLSEYLGLLLQPAVVFFPWQKLFYLDPGGETIYMTPHIGWCIKLGVNIFF